MPRVALLHAVEEFATELANAAGTVAPEYEIDVFSPTASRPARVRRALTGGYDVVQVDETLANGPLGLATSLFRRSELVVCFRGWADYTNAHGQYGPARAFSIAARTRAVLAGADEVVYLSESTRERIRERYAAPAGTVAGRPFDVERYGAGTADDGEGFEVLTVTNLRYEEKLRGVQTVLAGLDPLFEEYPDTTYRVAGGGRHLPTLREHVGDSEHADSVDVLGFREDVPDLLARADLFAYVSYLDSLAMTVLEAQAAGLPVVAGDAGGIPEAVGEAGVVCEPTPDGVTGAVRALRDDSGRLAALAERSRDRMATYNRDAARAYVGAWDDVLDR